MKKYIVLAILIWSATSARAQELQWAFRLLDFSSERTEEEYAAKNIVGDPYQQGKKSWQPKGSKKEEFIKVGFLSPKPAKQVIISGVFDPGQLQSVSVFDAGGKEFLLPCTLQGDHHVGYKHIVFPIEDDYLYILAVKVRLKPSLLSQAAIHGIGITEGKEVTMPTVAHAQFIDERSTVAKVENTVNTHFTEYGPLLAPDGKTLYFSRKHDAKNVGGEKDEEDIWFANWDEEGKQWKEAQNFGGPFNTDGPNFINSFTPDGSTMLLGNSYKGNGKLDGGVSVSHHTDSGWSFPERIYMEDERNTNEKANYFLSNDQTILLMSVERKGDTQGDRDLYVSFPQKDSTWSKPKNLGPLVNSIGTEAAPFLSEDGTTLFFATNGRNGFGGSDIYMVERMDDTWEHWSAPENLGPLVNTANDESFFSISTQRNQMFFTSVGSDKADVDIYRLDLPMMVAH